MGSDDPRPRSERTGYDPATGAYHVQHDWEDSSSLSYTVLTAVLALTGAEPDALGPIANVVDPDALDQLFRNRQQAGSPEDSVMLVIGECRVFVYRSGDVVLYPPDE